MNYKHLLASLLLLVWIPALSQAPQPAATAPGAKKPAVTPSAQHNQAEGERILQQNCGRCHNQPEGFSSRISGSIVLHMRVRASLSKHDEQELLRFFNP